MNECRVDVIIPTYRPDDTFSAVLSLLTGQTLPPEKIIIINTEEAYWQTDLEERFPRIELHHICKNEFDHGGTRHAAACLSSADIIVFMTQDAVPEGEELLERLTVPIRQGLAKISYARQLPQKDAGLIERVGRTFNYPETAQIKSLKDAETLGIKTFFCSDVCAAYDRDFYMASGGFPRPVIFNEDMIFAGRAVESGERIAYTADARIFHSHSLSGKEQFKRNFDLGVSQADYAELFAKYPSVGEGKKLIRTTAAQIRREGKYHLLFPLFWSGACRYAGYQLGKGYRRLPMRLIKRFSADPLYWERKERSDV